MTLDPTKLHALRAIAAKVTDDYDSINPAEIVAALKALPDLLAAADDRVSRREVTYIVDHLERQNKANDSYATAAMNTIDGDLWLICNSHVKDWTRGLRVLVTPELAPRVTLPADATE